MSPARIQEWLAQVAGHTHFDPVQTTSGQSAARLDWWLILEQQRARVSKEPQATGHGIGHQMMTGTRQGCQLLSGQQDPVLVQHVSDSIPPQRPARTVPAMRVGQRSGLAAQRAGCPQLRHLEARVHASQVPGSGHSGLGYSEVVPTAASRRSRQGPGFKPAHDAQPAAPMDCTPPIGAEVLPPLSHAPAAMEVEGQPPPTQPPSESPMEWASPTSRVGRRSSGRRVGETAPVRDMDCYEPAVVRNAQPSHATALPLRTPGSAQFSHKLPACYRSSCPVSPARIQEWLAQVAGHTHFDPVQTTSGQSAARLDWWLILEQQRARVSKAPQATGHGIGHQMMTGTRPGCQLLSGQQDPVLVQHVSDSIPPQRPARTVPAMRVGQRSGLAAQRAGCPQLRHLEARVHASQVPGSGHSGLGYSEVVPTAASRRSRQGPGFKPAHDAQPAAPMDCTPPIGAEVLPPLSHAPAAMEVEGQPPPSQPPSESPMEWASRRAGSGADRRAVGSVRQLPSAI